MGSLEFLQPRDLALLEDMLEAAEKAKEFSKDLSKEVFFESELHQLALVRLLQIIGEAARLVSEEARSCFPDLPWPQIVAVRHKFVHVYFDVDLNIVWSILMTDLDELIDQLSARMRS